MSIDSMTTLFSLMTLAAAAAVAVLMAGRLFAGQFPVLGQLIDWAVHNALLLAGIIAAIATAGSLYYSEVADFLPCKYCWYQRIAMYPLVLILGLGAARRDYFSRLPALLLAVIGFGWSIRHITVQQWPSSGGSCSVTVPCSSPYVEKFGFITIAWMAAGAFLLITTLLGLSVSADRVAAKEEVS